MHLVGNALNGVYFDSLIGKADTDALESIVLAVAYVKDLGPIPELATRRGVPLTLYALADEGGFPGLDVLRRFVESSPPSWQLFLTRNWYHPKIAWFRGVGCYIGSANLTGSGRLRNLECGVWLSQEDLDREGWTDELDAMLSVIRQRSAPATREDIGRFRRLRARRADLARLEEELRKAADRHLGHLPGQDPPDDVTARKDAGGRARASFVKEWNGCLTLLRNLGAVAAKARWPAWVERDVSPAVVFDQATEYWYTLAIRRSGEPRDATVAALHDRNRRDPEAAVRQVLDAFADFDGQDSWDWPAWCNEHPRVLRDLLKPDRLVNLDEATLADIVYRTHAAREHGRQVPNRVFGLPAGTKLSLEGRCEVYARYLLAQRTEAGRGIGEVLSHVLWGDRQRPEAAERVWDAVQDPGWRIPHLGANILGEMIGYARPDDYPPRNHRMVRTLYALGYDGVRP